MDLEPWVRDRVFNHIDQVKNWDIEDFDDEEEFIDTTIQTLDDFDIGGARIKTKKMHPSPKVDFSGPAWNSSRRAKRAATWIDETSAELADLMFVLTLFDNGVVQDRRVMLSQTKFSKISSSEPKDWKIKMHQYHLLHELPAFTVVQPTTHESFHLQPRNKTFTTFSFASDFSFPFFNSTQQIQKFLLSYPGTKTTTYRPQGGAPYGFESIAGILKRFVLQMYGEPFSADDEISDMIGHFYKHSSFDESSSRNRLADGGVSYDTGWGIVQIDVGSEEQVDFAELDQAGPRLP